MSSTPPAGFTVPLPDRPLEGRIALVTGASRGIGRAVSLALADAGAHVIALARTVGALEELDDEIKQRGGTATLLPVDLADGDALDALGPTLYQRWRHLDIFVANGGILGPLSPLHHITAQAWQSVIDTNLNANWRLVRTLDPILQRSEAGRVVFVSSGAASGTYAYWGPYAVSKAGVEALGRTYAQEVANSRVRANIINPGATATAMRAKAFPGEDSNTLPTPEDIAPLFVEMCLPDMTDNGMLISARDWLANRTSAAAEKSI